MDLGLSLKYRCIRLVGSVRVYAEGQNTMDELNEVCQEIVWDLKALACRAVGSNAADGSSIWQQ